jgi:hypothetical protein
MCMCVCESVQTELLLITYVCVYTSYIDVCVSVYVRAPIFGL